MSRSRSKSARKNRPLATVPASVAKTAYHHAAPCALHRVERIVALGPSIMLRAEQAERLSEFQHWHTGPSALSLTDARPIVCPILDGAFRPLRSPKGQPITSRIVLEVASGTCRRSPHGLGRPRTLWYFAAWDALGHLVHMSTHATRRAALSLFNQPADQLALSTQGQLIQLPADSARASEGVRHA